MISSITSVLSGIEQPDGQTIANARGFTDNDSNGALNVEMGEDWSGEEPVYVSDMYYAVSLVANTTYTIDYNGTPDEMYMPSVQFENSGGTSQGTAMSGDYDPETWEYVVVPASFTPSTSGVFYIHIAYSGEWTTIPLLVSPRPQERSCATAYIWNTIEGQILNGRPCKLETCAAIPAPVIHFPLLSSVQPTSSTASTAVNGETGDLVFNGEYCYNSSNNSDWRVTDAPVLTGSFTFSLQFNSDSDAASLIWLSPSNGGNDTAFRCLVKDSTSNGFSIQRGKTEGSNEHRGIFAYAPLSRAALGAWHDLVVCIDRSSNKILVTLDGNSIGKYSMLISDTETVGSFTSYVYTALSSPSIRFPSFHGKTRHLRIWNRAFDFTQMRMIHDKYKEN